MINKYDYLRDDELKYVKACLEFAMQLGQIADDSLEALERRRVMENKSWIIQLSQILRQLLQMEKCIK